jgi:diacylglycerol kinase family enzyme
MDALLIHNPTARPREVEDELDRVVEYLGEYGWRIQRCTTEHAGQATEFARQAVLARLDVVLVAGRGIDAGLVVCQASFLR